ncbi:MAG: hypothetical protein ACI4XC_06595 [Eubacterium sp.]
MKNDSWMFPTETPMDSMFDHNKDGKLTGLETMQRDAMLYDSYQQTTNNNSPSFTPNTSSGNSSFQNGFNIIFALAICLIVIGFPILTIIGFIKDADYFIEQPEFQFGIFVTIVDLIVLLVYVCKKIARSCEPDLSQCTTNEERSLALEKAEKEKQKKFIKLTLVIISICVAIGLIAFLRVDVSYRTAVNEAIDSDKSVWSFHFDTEKHPNYKDAQGWELYVNAKTYHRESYEDEFLKYEFKHTNSKQEKAIEELKNKINESRKEDNINATQEYHELVGKWYCSSLRSCNGGSITITITRKANKLYFNRNMIMSTSSASSNIDYEVELPVNDSFRVDDINCTYYFDGTNLKEKFDNDRENVFERKSDDFSTSYTTTAYYNGATAYSRYTTTKHYTTKPQTTKHYTKKDDPYNAKDYGNEDDFYEDHYDDFFDYYDAEDYYREHHDD